MSSNQITSPLIIDLFFTPAGVMNGALRNYRVVVIDVLRTATSMVVALNNGARTIIPVPSVSAAGELSAQLGRNDVLLCGERDAKMVEGFDVGNSPSEYTRDRVRGRTLIFGSTNGTPAIVKASNSQMVFICGFINIGAVVEALSAEDNRELPLAILCAGRLNSFSIEDAVCGGLIISRLRAGESRTLLLNDAARSAELLARELGTDLRRLVHESDHGRYLKEIGMEEDLTLCAAENEMSVVPVVKDGKIVKWERVTAPQ